MRSSAGWGRRGGGGGAGDLGLSGRAVAAPQNGRAGSRGRGRGSSSTGPCCGTHAGTLLEQTNNRFEQASEGRKGCLRPGVQAGVQTPTRHSARAARRHPLHRLLGGGVQVAVALAQVGGQAAQKGGGQHQRHVLRPAGHNGRRGVSDGRCSLAHTYPPPTHAHIGDPSLPTTPHMVRPSPAPLPHTH
jgi:hypothetical protein